MKRAFWLALGAGIVLVAALLAVLNAPVAGIFEQKIIASALDQGIGLRFEELGPSLIGLHAKRVVIAPKGALFSVELENAALRFPLIALLSLRPKARLSSLLCSGSLYGELEYSTRAPRLRLDLERAGLSEHPQLLALGVSSGELTLRGEDILLPPGDFPQGELSLKILDLSTRRETVLPVSVGPLPVTIPKLKSVNLSALIKGAESKIEISDVALSSIEHGELTGRIDLAIEHKRINTVRGEFDLKLSENALPFFTLARGLYGTTRSALAAEDLAKIKNWRISISGAAPPRIEYSPGSE